MKHILLLAALGGTLLAQTASVKRMNVAPGTQGEILLMVSAPHAADMIDLLGSNPAIRLSVLLPDGRRLTANNADEMGFVWETASDQDLPDQYWALYPSMLHGAGQHTVIALPEKLKSGIFRIRIDARGVRGVTRVSATHIVFRDSYITALRRLPGVQISDSVGLRARSTDGRREFVLRRAARPEDAEAPEMDVVVTDPQVRVSLQYPDGTVVTRATAKARGLDWQVTGWPPTSVPGEDPLGLGVLFMAAMMLPLEGTHHVITFGNGIPQDGVYRIHLDAADSKRLSQARAMFLPSEAIAEMFK
jgi:hypothetical protein